MNISILVDARRGAKRRDVEQRDILASINAFKSHKTHSMLEQLHKYVWCYYIFYGWNFGVENLGAFSVHTLQLFELALLKLLKAEHPQLHATSWKYKLISL